MQVRKGAAANGDGVEKGSGDRVRAMHLRASVRMHRLYVGRRRDLRVIYAVEFSTRELTSAEA